MALISRTGTFRGVVLDNGLAESSGGYPQLRLSLAATEYYDTGEQEWVDWSEQDEQTLAFLVVFGQDVKKALFHAKAIQKVFGWSGQGFEEFNSPDWVGKPIQFRVEENDYNNVVTLQVQAINDYDAQPGQLIEKADDATIKKLEAKYATGLKALGGTKVVSAKTTKPIVPKSNVVEPEPVPGDEDDAPDIDASTGAVSPPLTPEEKARKTTKTKAWRHVVKLKEDFNKETTDEELTKIWTDAVLEVAPKKKGKHLTEEEWFKVQELASNSFLTF